MESRWRKAKMSLGLNLCVYVPRTMEGDEPNTGSSTAALVSPMASSSSAATSANSTPTAAASEEQSHGKVKGGAGALMPTTPTPTSAGLRLSKSGSKSFKVPYVRPTVSKVCNLPRSIRPCNTTLKKSHPCIAPFLVSNCSG
jgi:hypothetical protein